ncbi:MAG: hypothetical protein ACRCSQ_04465 [Bacteroidales bacterium]
MNGLFKILLVAAIGIMGYLCVESIMGPIRFEHEKGIRDKATIQRLINIRKAQLEYRNLNGTYTASFDTLIDFVKTGQLPFVVKEGSLTDAQLESGLTEKKAMEIIKKGKQDEIAKNGLENFRRDTIFVNVGDTIFGRSFKADSLQFVPFTHGKAKFEMATGEILNASGYVMRLFEAKTPYTVYLGGLDKQEIINLSDRAKKTDKYPGLQVGSIVEPNNNAGNWE